MRKPATVTALLRGVVKLSLFSTAGAVATTTVVFMPTSKDDKERNKEDNKIHHGRFAVSCACTLMCHILVVTVASRPPLLR